MSNIVGAKDARPVRPRPSRRQDPDKALPASLDRKNRELGRHLRELRTFEEIASTMQTTLDVAEVQERVVIGLTERLGFRRAVVGLCDAAERYMTGWLASGEGGSVASVSHLMTVDLEGAANPVIEALRGDGVFVMCVNDVASDSERLLLGFFGPSPEARVAVVPVRCRGHLVGGLFVALPPGQIAVESETAALLERLATQAGIALANVRLCVERTQKLTQEQERTRIASEMHDVIAHALFGIEYQLSGTASRLPPGPVRAQLDDLAAVAHEALQQVRQAIFDLWPDNLTAQALEREVDSVACGLASGLTLRMHIAAEFDTLDLDLRKALLRICQEAVTNVARHAQATCVDVSIAVNTEVTLRVSDDGVGIVTKGDIDNEGSGFGLRTMKERAEAVGGTFKIARQRAGGSCITVTLPILSCRV